MDPRLVVMSLFAAALLCAAPVRAATPNLARCVGAHGEPMFAQTCPGRPAASTAAMPSRATAARSAGGSAARAAATAFCARSPQELAYQVQAALHARNGVRLSGYALWRGRSSSGVRGDVRELLQLMRAGFADVQLLQRPEGAEDDAAEFTSGARAQSGAGHALVITAMSQQRDALRSSERSFGITRERGCYWLTLAPAAWLADAPRDAAEDAASAAAALAWDAR